MLLARSGRCDKQQQEQNTSHIPGKGCLAEQCMYVNWIEYRECVSSTAALLMAKHEGGKVRDVADIICG